MLETIFKEGKPIVIKKCEFEYRYKLVLTDIFSNFRKVRFPMEEKYERFHKSIVSTIRQTPFEAMNIHVKPVVTLKGELYFQCTWNLLKCVPVFEASRSQQTEKKPKNPVSVALCKCKIKEFANCCTGGCYQSK